MKKNWIDVLDEEYFLSYCLRDLLEKVVEFSNYFALIINGIISGLYINKIILLDNLTENDIMT